MGVRKKVWMRGKYRKEKVWMKGKIERGGKYMGKYKNRF